MHLLIPFAAPQSAAARDAARALALPQLGALLALLLPQGRDDGDEWSLSPPHERALARALGWAGADGLLPWAARGAQADSLEPGKDAEATAWGLLTPAHWHLGTDQVSLLDPAGLMLDDTTSRIFFDAIHDLFTGDGYRLHYGTASRWYAAHDSLAALPTASLDRVIGRNVDRWLGKDPAARRIRRLQSEVQMRLYTHPLNDERIANGLLPVNSFWLSGCGVLQPVAHNDVQVDDRLRAPALAEDWAGWFKAWETLDAGPIAELLQATKAGQPSQLTLCGERASVTFQSGPRSLMRALKSRFATPDWLPLLESM